MDGDRGAARRFGDAVAHRRPRSTDYNPNYVSAPEEHPGGGWQLWMDCKGGIYPLMAATQLRILVEELRRAGVTDVRIGPWNLGHADAEVGQA